MGMCSHMFEKKAKNYNICSISYSRRILWLKAAESNNNPHYITKYYVDCVRELQGQFHKLCTTVYNYIYYSNNILGSPCLLRTDRGTENSLLSVVRFAPIMMILYLRTRSH